MTDWPQREPYGITNRGVGIELSLTLAILLGVDWCAALQCPYLREDGICKALCLKNVEGVTNQFVRVKCNGLRNVNHGDIARDRRMIYVQQSTNSGNRRSEYPVNLFSLRDLEDHCNPSAPYQWQLTHYVGYSLSIVPNCPPGVAHQPLWVRSTPSTNFKVIRGFNALSVVLVFVLERNEYVLTPFGRPSPQRNPIAIVLGMMANHNIGFDVCEVHKDSRAFRTPML